ncbi:hypothetical protein BKG79_22430 [Mycobacteroides chelonae]|uniref:hypothetical protein n=1 Tax=Mycobacteroides chelonae TaxID=1774 RepID=UPI0009239D5F|nr:hypothetical protein [Mycobacteroides chelonae]OHU33362.1 hypothetical protein BKG79_22430 [Mycobacteroides chelonae]
MTATLTAENLVQSHTCPDCQHTQRIDAISAALDPDRLADRVRAQLRTWSGDEDDADLILYGSGHEFAVDVAEHEVWEGQYTRSAEQQLHLALVHMAAALAAGAKL